MARTLAVFDARSMSPPSSGAALVGVRQGGITTLQQTDAIGFADNITATADFYGRMPVDYAGGNLLVVFSWAAGVANSGDCRWLISWQRHEEDVDDLDSLAFATAKALDAPTASAAGEKAYDSITFSNAEADAIAAGEDFCIRIEREGGHANDTVTGIVQLFVVEIREA